MTTAPTAPIIEVGHPDVPHRQRTTPLLPWVYLCVVAVGARLAHRLSMFQVAALGARPSLTKAVNSVVVALLHPLAR